MRHLLNQDDRAAVSDIQSRVQQLAANLHYVIGRYVVLKAGKYRGRIAVVRGVSFDSEGVPLFLANVGFKSEPNEPLNSDGETRSYWEADRLIPLYSGEVRAVHAFLQGRRANSTVVRLDSGETMWLNGFTLKWEEV
tara:strand:- start:281 stop:691 length:411 start_codon:yes stop_codon:yes gene_type:complete